MDKRSVYFIRTTFRKYDCDSDWVPLDVYRKTEIGEIDEFWFSQKKNCYVVKLFFGSDWDETCEDDLSQDHENNVEFLCVHSDSNYVIEILKKNHHVEALANLGPKLDQVLAELQCHPYFGSQVPNLAKHFNENK